jgi:RNA recognition motif-containing protein
MHIHTQVGRLAPDVNKIIFVKNLPFKISSEELYDIFGKFGAIRQIRMFVLFLPLNLLPTNSNV